ncbi:hemerythrin domain-containing protein [Caballeronia sp. J97]|uniref:hemerythrin domain-containing protein n=1 Tax=Caballeronia sp. J97 TaxID=2805429 RepID=UPI002AB2E139|nr:hemerythrin domain-containing protein [Caballeronia sp. J97]
MNDTTERTALHVIRLDHKRLAAVTAAMLDFVHKLGSGGPAPDPIILRAMLYYIREYPEQLHHPMEDRLLFAALRNRTDEYNAVLDELHREHVAGEVRLRDLEHALTRFELKGEAALFGLRTIMEEYVEFCENHRRVEETVILPAALRHLLDVDWARIDAAIDRRFDPFREATFEGESLESLYRLIAKAVPAVEDISNLSR